MKYLFKQLATISLIIGATLLSPLAKAQAQDGYIDLINGGSLSNWNFVGDANWSLSSGMIESNKPKGFLVGTKTYTNFIIQAEFWAEPNTNSGIFMRCQDLNVINSSNAYEVNIWDLRPGQEYSTGAIVDVAKVNPVPKAGGRWNTMEIVANGSHFKVTLNGEITVADGQDSKFAAGPIAIQSYGGTIKFRKLQIKPL
jgi:hypothetical protein